MSCIPCYSETIFMIEHWGISNICDEIRFYFILFK